MKQKHALETTATRRTLLSALLAVGSGIALPDKWTKPVLRSLVLPAHAQLTSDPVPPPAETPPLRVSLNGVVDGEIGTEFTVSASASGGLPGASLSFSFTASDACAVLSQNAASAVIRRGLIAGSCSVAVTVTDGRDLATDNASAQVTGAPPDPPGP